MSEPMFPTVDAAERPAPVEPDGSGGTSRKAMFAVGGALGALALGAGAFVLLTGSGGSADDTSAAVAPRAAASAPAPAPTPSRAVVTIKTVAVAARDPFAVLFPAPKPAPAAPAAANQAPGTTTTTPQVATVPTTTIAVSVSAVNPTKQSATVSIDGTKYAATIGKVFAKTFVLYSVFNTQCVGLLYGDKSVPVCTTAPATVSP
jgi:hypothetical protein